MSRPIKFRAWDGETRTMHEDVGVYRNRITARDNESLLLGRHDYPLMQFTGLTDKNGKEIYEGDVLRMKPAVWTYSEHLLEIIWEEKYATFQAMTRATLGHAPGTAKVGTPYSMSLSAQMEVIGNIYENPELHNAKEV